MDYDSSLPKDLANLVRDYVGKDLWTIHESGDFRPDGVYLYPPYHPRPRLNSPWSHGCVVRFHSVQRRWWMDTSGGHRWCHGLSLTKHGRHCCPSTTKVLTPEQFKRQYPHYEVLQRYYEDHTFLCILR